MIQRKIKCGWLMLLVVFALCAPLRGMAANLEAYSSGIYEVEATLSCYVNAMGGVEFGAPLLVNSIVSIDANGNKKLTMYFTKSSISIYSVTCDTFIDPNPSGGGERGGVSNGTIGYYDADGVLQKKDVDITISSDTALNSENKEVPYVSSITIPLTEQKESYQLALYINSNVMGVQFSSGVGTAGESIYPATLKVNWDSLLAEQNTPAVASQEGAVVPSITPAGSDGAPVESNVSVTAEETMLSTEPEAVSEESDAIEPSSSAETAMSAETTTTAMVVTNDKLLKIAAVTGLALLGVGILLYLFSKPKGKKAEPTSTNRGDQ